MLTAILRVPALRLPLLERERFRPTLRLPTFRMPTIKREHLLASLVLATLLGLYLFAGLTVLGISAPDGRALAKPNDLANAALRPPEPEPMKLVEMAPQDAVAHNAAMPLSDLPNPPARPFLLAATSAGDRARAIQCLTSAVYYESAIEPLDGQRAVAQVVLNRVRHPAYPSSVCGVVYQGSQRATGCQFTFTCDGSLARGPHAGLWRQARQVAEAALAGYVYKPVGWATHYHTNWVVPYWSSSLLKAANVGTHIFYRWTGGWGMGPAFRSHYAGAEPDVSRLGRHSPLDARDALAAAAALAAMTPEQRAAAELLPDGRLASPSSMDSFQRAVLRRYEPMPGSAVTALLASQAKDGDKAGSTSMRWALAGDEGAKPAPLGRKPAAPPRRDETTAPPAAPAAGPGAGLSEAIKSIAEPTAGAAAGN